MNRTIMFVAAVFLFSGCSKVEIHYPLYGLFGENILHENVTTIESNQTYSMAAEISDKESGLIIEISDVDKNCEGCWYYPITSNKNWFVHDDDAHTQTFESLNNDLDLKIGFIQPGEYQIIFYEPIGDGSMTSSKLIIVE